MNSNTILLRLGIDPSDFINEDNEPIINKDSFVYEARQRTNIKNAFVIIIISKYNWQNYKC